MQSGVNERGQKSHLASEPGARDTDATMAIDLRLGSGWESSLEKTSFCLLFAIAIRSSAVPNESSRAKLRQNEAIHHIFQSERKTVSQFVKFRPMVETYGAEARSSVSALLFKVGMGGHPYAGCYLFSPEYRSASPSSADRTS